MIVSILCGGNEPLTPILTEYCQVNVAQAIVYVAAIILLIIAIVYLLIKSNRRLVFCFLNLLCRGFPAVSNSSPIQTLLHTNNINILFLKP